MKRLDVMPSMAWSKSKIKDLMSFLSETLALLPLYCYDGMKNTAFNTPTNGHYLQGAKHGPSHTDTAVERTDMP